MNNQAFLPEPEKEAFHRSELVRLRAGREAFFLARLFVFDFDLIQRDLILRQMRGGYIRDRVQGSVFDQPIEKDADIAPVVDERGGRVV